MINEYKVDKIAGFLYKALEYGYSYNDSWDILTSSSSGKEILNNSYSYIYHIQGATSFYYAVDLKNKKIVNHNIALKKIELLAEFIEFAHEHGIPYEAMFKKESLNSFMSTCGDFLGNYDEKLLDRIA